MSNIRRSISWHSPFKETYWHAATTICVKNAHVALAFPWLGSWAHSRHLARYRIHFAANIPSFPSILFLSKKENRTRFSILEITSNESQTLKADHYSNTWPHKDKLKGPFMLYIFLISSTGPSIKI
jgi:hypothetical protein